MATQMERFGSPTIGQQTVIVHVPNEVLFNLERAQTVIKNVVTQFGCGGCHSGLDIRLVPELEYVVDAKTLELTPIAVERGEITSGQLVT